MVAQDILFITLAIGFIIIVIFASVALGALTRLLIDLRKKNTKPGAPELSSDVPNINQAFDEVTESFKALAKNIWELNSKVFGAVSGFAGFGDWRSGKERGSGGDRRSGFDRRSGGNLEVYEGTEAIFEADEETK